MLLLLMGAGLLLFLASQSRADEGDTPIDDSGGDLPKYTGTFSPKVVTLGQAISRAEGYGPPANLSTMRNNPGSIFGGGVLLSYPSQSDGFNALYKLVSYMESGKSKYYPWSMTFLELGWMYVNGTKPSMTLVHSTDHPTNWAVYVAGAVGMTLNNTLADYFGD